MVKVLLLIIIRISHLAQGFTSLGLGTPRQCFIIIKILSLFVKYFTASISLQKVCEYFISKSVQVPDFNKCAST